MGSVICGHYRPAPTFSSVCTRTLVLTFFRLGQFCDEQHRHIPRLRRQVPEPLLEIHSHTATAAGIADGDVFARVRPEGKAEIIQRLQDGGQRAAFAGDGVNDAAALARADLGMAIGTGTDVAIGAADLTLVSGNPDGIADAIQLSRATMTVIRANLIWAFGYNVIAIPVAALGYLNPLFAGIAMSASSLVVVANSLRMRRFTPRGRPQ